MLDMRPQACHDMRVMKKYLAIFLSLLVVGAPLQAQDDEPARPSAAEARNDKKEAQNWYKNAIKNKQQALKILKKVKDKKTADKAGRDLQRLYGVSGHATAMGESGPAQKPTGPAMDELEAKNGPKLEKLDEQINEQRERIESLNIDSEELQRGLEAMDAAS